MRSSMAATRGGRIEKGAAGALSWGPRGAMGAAARCVEVAAARWG